jgi:hypothetical protein
MAADDVADLVRDDALYFVGGVGLVDQAGVEIDGLTACNERVDAGIVEQDDAEILGIKTGGDRDRASRSIDWAAAGCAQRRSAVARPARMRFMPVLIGDAGARFNAGMSLLPVYG